MRPLLLIIIALLLIGGGVAAFLLFPGEAEAGEVFLIPAASAGPDPFSDTPFAEAPDPTVALPATASSTPIPASPNATPVQATSGAKPGLYGGTMNRSACNPDQMVSFLASNPDKAQAWVSALTADPQVRLRDGRPLTTASIPDYVAGLTSIVLTSDTRVTNHGFKNGRQTVLQSVLQKGSAVMVDEYGVPRVKCYCGNPLLPPVPSNQRVTYYGPRWEDFDESKITVISPPPAPIQEFTVCDPRDPSQCFSVPPGGVPGRAVPPNVARDGEGPNPTASLPPGAGRSEPPTPLVESGPEVLGMCSTQSTQAMEVSIVNTTREPATVVWSDEDCNRQTTLVVGPGETAPLSTYNGHVFVAIVGGADRSEFTADPSDAQWVIR